jgi:hypothetical protein
MPPEVFQFIKMKTLFLALLLSTLTLHAQGNGGLVYTNTQVFPNHPLAAEVATGKESGQYELTLGGSGITIKDESSYGLDFSLSTNPFKKLPEVWIGMAQGIAWEPKFSGATDLFSDYSWHIWNDTIYLNTGWSVGVVYDASDLIGRTGPEVYLQYYLSDNAFIYTGANYDFVSKGDNSLRFSVGIGFSF